MQGNAILVQVWKYLSLGTRETENLNSVRTSQDRQNRHGYLERKAELAVRGESAAQKRSTEAYETHRELEAPSGESMG